MQCLEESLERLGMLALKRLATLVWERRGHEKNNDCFIQAHQKSLIVGLYKGGQIFVIKMTSSNSEKGKQIW